MRTRRFGLLLLASAALLLALCAAPRVRQVVSALIRIESAHLHPLPSPVALAATTRQPRDDESMRAAGVSLLAATACIVATAAYEQRIANAAQSTIQNESAYYRRLARD